MSIELIINIVVICLLVPTIVFAVVLNKRLEILRNSRADLGRLIEAFNDATTRAESGIPRLKQAADSAGGLLRDQIQKAQTLRDDMAFMIERADAIVRRLDDSMHAMPARPVVSDDALKPAVYEQKNTAPVSGGRKKRVLAEKPEDLISSAVSAAQDILRDVEEQKTPKAAKKPLPSMFRDDVDSDRSEAERELLKALQSMR